MGRETKNFRQKGNAGRADASNKAYARVNRQGPWNKPLNIANKNNEVK